MSEGDVVARARRAGRTYGSGPTAVVALQPTDCELRAGGRVAIVGPSGSGKSTLLHLLAGLEHPTVGGVEWPTIGDRSALRPGPVAVVFQAPSLLPALTVIENVALPLALSGSREGTALRGAEASLRHLGLEDLADKLPDEISGGQAQRVAVARALVDDPQLILADEPTGQLDSASGASVVDALLAAASAAGAALAVATHEAGVIERLDERWTVHGGHLTTEGATWAR